MLGAGASEMNKTELPPAADPSVVGETVRICNYDPVLFVLHSDERQGCAD